MSYARDGIVDIDDACAAFKAAGGDSDDTARVAEALAQVHPEVQAKLDEFTGGALSRIVQAEMRDEIPTEADCAALNSLRGFMGIYEPKP